MKVQVQEGGFRCVIAQLLMVFCSFFCTSGIAQADCKGGVGTEDIVISNKATDFYSSDDIVYCVTTGSITLGPYVTLPDGAVFSLIAPRVSIDTEVEALLGSQLRIYTGRRPLNDTGIVNCSDDDTNNLACPVVTHPGQDAEYGRDVTYPDDADGHAGFSFTKLDANGNPMSSSAISWSCVKDNVTGLAWEVKTDDGGLHDRDDRYFWYNTDSTSNGGDPGSADGGAICYGYDSTDSDSYCNTQAYVARMNQEGWCGHNDWRMPTREELRTIVDYSVPFPGPTIDTDYFPNDQGWHVWSASPTASGLNYAWILRFYHGTDSGELKSSANYVRLVRGGQ